MDTAMNRGLIDWRHGGPSSQLDVVVGFAAQHLDPPGRYSRNVEQQLKPAGAFRDVMDATLHDAAVSPAANLKRVLGGNLTKIPISRVPRVVEASAA